LYRAILHEPKEEVSMNFRGSFLIQLQLRGHQSCNGVSLQKEECCSMEEERTPLAVP
jgi:hypothetical protein